MALGDITILKEGAFGNVGSRTFQVAPSATKINAGEPVAIGLGNGISSTKGGVVTPAATSTPVIMGTATNTWAGVAASTSTNTSTATGTVEVWPLVPGTIYMIAPKTGTSWDTQTEYDNLVGARVTLDLTTSTYTINATDSGTAAAYNGLVVEPLDISKYPSKVAFSIHNRVNYLTATL